MSGETAAFESAWTIDSLKEHLETAIGCLKELVEQHFELQEKAAMATMTASDSAIDKVEKTSEKWREASNEWRAAMNDRERDFMRRDAYERAHTDLIDRVEMMNRTLIERHDALYKTLNDKIDTLTTRVAEIAAIT